jgi:pimeloyl-ACP methyl ester carboxylesterase
VVYWGRLAAFAAAALFTALALLAAGLIYLQVVSFTTPFRNTHIDSPLEFNRPYKNIILTTADGLKISGWHIEGSRPQAIIMVHGIGSNRATVLPEAAVMAAAGYHLVLIDLRAHGLSEGSVNTYGYFEAQDVLAAVDYCLVQPGITQVGAIGTSLGGAVVARAAAQDSRLAAVVIISSYSSLPEAMDDAFDTMAVLPRWPFAPLIVRLAEWRVGVKIGQVNSAASLAALSPRPVMIIHGTADDLFPVRHAHVLFAAAREPKTLWLIEGLGHANPVPGREAEFAIKVGNFFERAFQK